MKVQEVLFENNIKRYLLVDSQGSLITPVCKYLKYIDNTKKSYNTQKTYAHALKQYFDFLDKEDIDYKIVNLEILAKFVGWLRNPYGSTNTISIVPIESKRSEKTINLIITVVTNFYDFLFRNNQLQNNLTENLKKTIFSGGKVKYKGFLYHITKGDSINKNLLKLKVPKKKVQVLSKDEIEILYSMITNIRDEFLVKLLFETGLRIGEALSLFIEDIIFDHKNGHRIRLVNRGELQNGCRLKSGEREIYISQELFDLFDDYTYEILDELEIDTNFLFVKLKGKDKGKPLEYHNVRAIFDRLKKVTGIDVHAHILRHTHATLYYNATKDIKQVQERLGHSQIQTTMNLYLHPSDEDIRKNWEIAQPSFRLDKRENNND